jgi:peptide/nickel transport system permease protein
MSFQWNLPVTTLIGQRLPLTLVLTLTTTILVYLIAVPIGIYSATHQYSPGDYVATFFGFIGIALPNFLIALILLYLVTKYLGWGVIGLFSRDFIDEPWSFAKFVDLLKHIPVPVVVLAVAGTAGLIRTMRATLLDELQRQYVMTARSKGLTERRLLYKYPVRLAINPIISGIGGFLPALFSGETIVSMVLGLPTMGPLLFEALSTQDTYLAGSIVMIISMLTVVGVFVSDMLLLVVDPRIKFVRGT